MKKLYLILFALVNVTLAQAQIFSYNGINYRVTDTSNFYVEVTNNPGFSGAANIPSTVVYNSNNYTVESIGNIAFQNCSGLTSIVIPNSVALIGGYAFANCSGLTSVTIPNSVSIIGYNAFDGCTGLTSVSIPNSVYLIDEYAFRDCTSLTSVAIPISVTTIMSGAFQNCSGLTSVSVGWTNPLYIETSVFANVTLSGVILNVPSGTEVTYNAAQDWTDFNIFAPTDISLSANTINENVVINSTVGSLSSTDLDGGNTHTYTLVSGAGSTNNTAFNISGNSLRITNSPDFETQNSYSIRIRTTDQGGLFYEKTFTITINDLQEAPRGCWAQVSVGGYHTLAIAQDGTLWAWGDNAYGQLGAGTVGTDELNPKQVSPDGNWKFVSAGEFYSLAIKNDGTLWAWGRNNYGQIGNGTVTQQNIPVKIGTETNWVDVCAGYRHSIARKVDNTIYAWGYNSSGQLGINSTAVQQTPIQVGTDNNWQTVSLGRNHTVALKSNGELWAWGSSVFGQLGTGNYTQQLQPIRIGTETTWKLIEAGDYYNVALKNDGTLYSWGDNTFGQLGQGDTTERNSPTQVGTDNSWKSIATGLYNGYATKSTGTLWTWGENTKGQLGNGTFTEQHSPVQAGSEADWYSVIAGDESAIAQKNAGNFYSWGDNQSGELGNGTTLPNTTGQNTPGNMGCSANVLAFDGVDDKATIPNTGTSVLGDNSENKSYSVEMKVKFNVVPIYHYLCGKEDVTSGFSLSMRYDRLNFYQAYDAGRRSGIEYPISIMPNTWYSIVATFDYPTKTQKLYVNGVLVGSITDTGTPSFSNAEIFLGFEPNSGGAFYGKMSEFRIWDKVRTAQDAASYRSNQQQTLTTDVNLLAHYKFNQGVANGNNAGLTTLYNEVVGGPVGTLQNFTLNGSTSNWSYDNDALETLNTNEFSITDNVKVYPNPSTGIFTIAIENEATVKVYDMLGKEIYTNTVKTGTTNIDISNYQSGIYLLNVITENGSVTKKIIKE